MVSKQAGSITLPALIYPSNSLIYLYAVVLLTPHSLANSVRLNTPFLYAG